MCSLPYRGLSTGLYITNSSEDCRNVLKDSKANIVIVENDKFLNKILVVCVCVVYKYTEYIYIFFENNNCLKT